MRGHSAHGIKVVLKIDAFGKTIGTNQDKSPGSAMNRRFVPRVRRKVIVR